MKKLNKFFVFLLNGLPFFVAKLVPKNDRIWVFGAWFGNRYADNTRFLFEYVNKNHPEIRAVWITDNQEVLDKLNFKGFEAYRKYSFMAMALGMRAQYSICIQSNASDLMPFLNNGKTKVVQLWHGVPLKKIGYDDQYAYLPGIKTKVKDIIFPFLYEEYDLLIANSKEDKKSFSSAFSSKKIVVTGYPRNDLLFLPETLKISNILYLPTFRDSVGSEVDLFSDFSFDFDEWNLFLRDSGVTFYIKMHPVNRPKEELLDKFKQNSNIRFLDDVDVADLLPMADILITDYSSVYFDFLLTEKPIIFTPFDYDKYISKDRELYYPYDEVTPGPKCNNWNEVLEWVVKFKDKPSIYSEERGEIKNKFHKYDDFKSCERVYQEIIKI